MNFERKYANEIKLFQDIYFPSRDVKKARIALEQRKVHPRLINKIADFVLSSLSGASSPFSGGQRSLTMGEDEDILDIQKRAGIVTELNKEDSFVRKDAHRRAMKQFDEITKPLAKLSSLAYDADIPIETLVEEIREMVLEMYGKKDERQSRKPDSEEFDPS
jgi:hypothetical protein